VTRTLRPAARTLDFLGLGCVGLTGALASGCVVYDPKLVERDAGAMDTGLDASGLGGSRQPPARPTEPDDGVDVGEVSFGLRQVVLDQAEDDLWRGIGYDLDNRYTVSPTLDTECTPPAGVNAPQDGNEGIDNVFGASLYPLVELTVPGLEATARAAQEEGYGLPVIRISGWNGTPNDARVRAVITTSVFTTSAQGAGPDMPPIVDIRSPRDILVGGDPAPAPAWDGNDWSWVRSDSYVGAELDQPLIVDNNAYVSGGVVVTRLPAGIDILFPAMDVGILVRLTDAIATGVFDADGNLGSITVAGRWSIADPPNPAENVGICRGTVEYNILRGQLDRVADVMRQPSEPGDPVLDCEALSLGVTFVGTRMRIAGLADGAEVLNQCLNDAGVLFQDAGTVFDAFVPADAPAAPDAFAPDAFAPDAGPARDAFLPPDAPDAR